MENKLELRMYGFVNYQLTGIQMGIQFSHALVEYSLENSHSDDYLDWANNWKTVIVLNGGSTNNNSERLGTINQILKVLIENNIICSFFNEPDLGDQLTSVVFIVDERVFNREKYPDFEDWLINNYGDLIRTDQLTSTDILAQKIIDSKSKSDKKIYNEWVQIVGGDKNIFLRNFLKNFKLA